MYLVVTLYTCFQCFGTVGLAAGMASNRSL